MISNGLENLETGTTVAKTRSMILSEQLHKWQMAHNCSGKLKMLLDGSKAILLVSSEENVSNFVMDRVAGSLGNWEKSGNF